MILLIGKRRPQRIAVVISLASAVLLLFVRIYRQRQLADRASRIVGRTQEHERTWRETFDRFGSNDTKT